VLHGLSGSQALLVIIAKQLVQEINGRVRDEALVLWRHKFAPWLTGISSENLIVVNIQLQIVLLQVSKQLVGTENTSNLDKLIVVIVSMEEWLLTENLFSANICN
jgi:hypothetical protein